MSFTRAEFDKLMPFGLDCSDVQWLYYKSFLVGDGPERFVEIMGKDRWLETISSSHILLPDYDYFHNNPQDLIALLQCAFGLKAPRPDPQQARLQEAERHRVNDAKWVTGFISHLDTLNLLSTEVLTAVCDHPQRYTAYHPRIDRLQAVFQHFPRKYVTDDLRILALGRTETLDAASVSRLIKWGGYHGLAHLKDYPSELVDSSVVMDVLIEKLRVSGESEKALEMAEKTPAMVLYDLLNDYERGRRLHYDDCSYDSFEDYVLNLPSCSVYTTH